MRDTMLSMRIQTISLLLAVFLFAGCVKTEPEAPPPTPAEAAQMETQRLLAIEKTEALVGRPLTAEEKKLVTVRLEDGQIKTYVEPNLVDNAIKRRREQAAAAKSAATQSAVTKPAAADK